MFFDGTKLAHGTTEFLGNKIKDIGKIGINDKIELKSKNNKWEIHVNGNKVTDYD